MSSIQEIHELEQRIYDIVQDYLNGNYDKTDVLAIGRRCGKITLNADAKEAIGAGNTTEIHTLKDMVRIGDDGEQEPDIDKISDIANSWLFLD